ncbi:MAG: MerR family DNA-binding transcriptional regulator [Rectinemataceae bacterium]
MAHLGIGQVERLLGIPATTLRFWEKTVPYLAPVRTPSGRRAYSIAEAALLSRLKHLALDRRLGLTEAASRLELELLYADPELRARLAGLRFECLLLAADLEQSRERIQQFAAEIMKEHRDGS